MTEHLLLLGLPFLAGAEAQQPSAQFGSLTRQLGTLGGALRQFSLPSLKVGTLDSLMEASDDLAKLDPQFETTVQKLLSIMEEASQKSRSAVSVLRVNQSQEMTPDGYLKHFQWNTAQFDVKEPIRNLIQKISQVSLTAEERARQLLADYSDARNRLQGATRKNQGSLSIRPIGDAVSKWSRTTRNAVVDTELLVTMFVAVPVASQAEWTSTYWQINEFVCPQSSQVVAEDKEFVLNSVVLFKKVAEDFKLGCRKRKFIVREATTSDDLSAEECTALQAKVEKDKVTLLTVLSQQYSLCYVAWIHIKALRIFVESLLKYGLPPRFLAVTLAVDERKEKEIRKAIANLYPDLKTPLSEELHDSGALQHEFAYVSLKVTNLQKS